MMYCLSESATRKQLIDQQLAQAGWGTAETQPIAEYCLAIADDAIGYADYVLR